MATTMLGLLGVFLFVLSTNANPTPSSNFNVSKVEGKWYLSAVASSSRFLDGHKLMDKGSVVVVTVTADGNLQVNGSHLMRKDPKRVGCVKVSRLLRRSETPGRVATYSMHSRTKDETTILDVKDDEYIITQTKWTLKKNVTFTLELFTREPLVSEAIRKKFSQFAMKRHIDPERIRILPYKGECV
ncbi:lipocalin-like [Clarias gariepinus]|uniref:lipocalin-like n=1 Tax=Clarias gariepinus TaxID=13013 RepID=UPI00234D9248|nr:lipocalin-like [Clarias gariepinus]XP_053349967.1 lipocalin-like [Clarias gariepinus]